MYEVTEIRTEDMIASEIRTIVHQTQKQMLDGAIEIGRRLVEAKELVAHGEWMDWLKIKVNFSRSTANNFMQIFEAYGDKQVTFFGAVSNSQSIGNLSYTKALRLLAVPEDDREEFAKEVDAESISVRELEDKIKAMQAEKETIEKDAKDMKEQLRKAVAENDTYVNRENDLVEQINELQEKQQGASQADIQQEIDKAVAKVQEDLEKLKKQKEDSDKEIQKLQRDIENQEEAQKERIADEVAQAAEQARAQERAALKEELDRIKLQAEEATKKETEAERKLQASSNATLMKFKFLVDRIQLYYKEAIDTIAEAEQENEDEAERFKTALSRVLEKMQDEVAL